MADTQDVIVRYKSEVDQAVDQIEQLAKAQDKITDAEKKQGKQSKKTAAAEEQATKKRLDNLRREEAELKTLQSLLKKAFTAKDIDEYNRKIAESQKRISLLKGEVTGASSVTQKLGSIGTNVFAGIAAGAAAAFSVDAIINFSKASVNAFLEAEKNAQKLKFAITAINGESEQQFNNLIKQSEELQKITIFSDDSIQAAQAQLAAFSLTADEIDKLIPKLADFATITSVDIPQAANQIGAALEGNGREFKKYGIEVSATASRTENLNSILQGLTKFEGSATEATKTLSGALQQQENDVDNLQERIGSKLAPAYVRAKQALFEFVNLILTSRKDIKREAFNKTVDDLQLKALDQVKQRAKSIQAIRNITPNQAYLEALKAEIKLTEESINELALSGRVSDDIYSNRKFQLEALVQEQERFNKELKQQEDIAAANAKRILSLDALRKKSTEELTALAIKEKEIDDDIAKNNIKNIEAVLKAREEYAKELEKNQKLLKDLQIQNIEDEKQRRIAAFEREKNELTANGKLRADIITELEKKLVNDLNEIDKKRNVDPLFKVPEQQVEQKPVLPPDIQGQVDSLIASGKTEAEAIKQVFEDIRKSFKDGSDSIEMSWIDANAQILSSSIELFGELTNLYNNFADARIDKINQEKQAQLDALDLQMQANTEALENRQINNKQEEALNKKLAADKVEVEKKADKEIRKIQRQQAILDKANALFQIALNTAIALADAKNLATFGALSPIIIALGLAQAATVAATPIPGFEKGTKGKRGSGIARVGEVGEETVFLPHNSKVVPNKQTIKYAPFVDAMIDNNLEKYIHRQFVMPQLLAQKKAYEQKTDSNNSGNFAENAGRSARLYVENKGQNVKFPSGMNIQNTDELASAIAREISTSRRRLI